MGRGILHEAVEEQDVRVVESRVHLVQEEEGDGAVEEDREDERDRRQGFFAAGEERDALRPFPRDPDVDVHARLEEVILVGQAELSPAAGEEAGEDLLEALVDPREGLGEPLPGDGVDPGDRLLERLQGGVQVGDLAGKELVAGLELLVLGEGEEIDLAEILDGLPVLFELCGKLRQHRLLQRLECREELNEVRAIFFLDIPLEVLHLQGDLPGGDLYFGPLAELPVEDFFDFPNFHLPRPKESIFLLLGVPLSGEGLLDDFIFCVEAFERLLLGGDPGGLRLRLAFAVLRVGRPGGDLAGVVAERGLQVGQRPPVGLPLFLEGCQADLPLGEAPLSLLQIGPERIPPLPVIGHRCVENRLLGPDDLHLRLVPCDLPPGVGGLRGEVFPVEIEGLEPLPDLAQFAFVPFDILAEAVDPEFREVELRTEPEELLVPLGDQGGGFFPAVLFPLEFGLELCNLFGELGDFAPVA